MKNFCSIIFIFGLLFISISCSSQSNQQEKPILDQTQNEINAYLDSANYYFDIVIAEKNKGIKNEEIVLKYNYIVERIETDINEVLDYAHKLVKDGVITDEEYDELINGIDLSSVMEKHKKIKSLGINFEELPVTNYHKLEQYYVDSINNLSISFPADWTVMDDYEDFTLMGAGAMKISGKMVRDGAFVVMIAELEKNFSTEEYFKSNKNYLRNEMEDFKLLEEKDINLNGVPAKFMTLQCIANGILSTSVQIYFSKDSKGYILNGSAPVENIKDYRDLYIEIGRTF